MNQTAISPRPHKHLLQFSLRTALVLTAILCALVAWKREQLSRYFGFKPAIEPGIHTIASLEELEEALQREKCIIVLYDRFSWVADSARVQVEQLERGQEGERVAFYLVDRAELNDPIYQAALYRLAIRERFLIGKKASAGGVCWVRQGVAVDFARGPGEFALEELSKRTEAAFNE